MNDRLATLYRGVAVHATADSEHRAALQLLTLVMLADGHVENSEIDVMREISTEWRGDGFAFEDHIGESIDSVRTAIDEQRIEELLDDIDASINSRVLRSALFSAARDVAGADHEVTSEEGTILGQVAARFD